MTQKELTVNWTEGGMLIAGAEAGQEGRDQRSWKVSRLDGERWLVFAKKFDENPSEAVGVGVLSRELLYDVLVGINHRGWSGLVSVDVGGARKKLYFSEGECVFAASDLMDDRLGEVIYREALISMEQLTNFSVQVDRKTKFGQVLLRSYQFNNTDLWNALKTQVRGILFSAFLVDRSYVELHESSARFEVIFEEGTRTLLEAAFSHGCQLKSFRSRIDATQTRVFPVDNPELGAPAAGTFAGDIVELCKDGPLLMEAVSRSKLTEGNTLISIQKFVAKGFLRIEGLVPATVTRVEMTPFGGVRAAIDAYQMLHQNVTSEFLRANLSLPARDLNDFALSLNSIGDCAIFLDANGALTNDSADNILHQCAANRYRIEYFRNRLGTLSRYLLQVSSDLLPQDVGAKLRDDFQEIVS